MKTPLPNAPASTCRARDTAPVREALEAFLEWDAAHRGAPVEELWAAYDRLLRVAWEPFGAAWIAARVAPAHRAPLASACAELARARAWFAPRPGREGAWEVRLWEVALSLDKRGTEGAGWSGEGFYTSPSHRLADLYRRAGRSDAQAMSCLIEVATGPTAAPFPGDGPGSHHRAEDLIYEGARITADEPTSLELVRARLGLCLRLKLRGFAAHWVASSIEVGQARLKQAPRAKVTARKSTPLKTSQQAVAEIIALAEAGRRRGSST